LSGLFCQSLSLNDPHPNPSPIAMGEGLIVALRAAWWAHDRVSGDYLPRSACAQGEGLFLLWVRKPLASHAWSISQVASQSASATGTNRSIIPRASISRALVSRYVNTADLTHV